MKAMSVRIRVARREDIDRIVEIERSWVHLSHWSVDAYRRLVNEDSFTSSMVAESEDPDGGLAIVGFVIFHVTDDSSEIYNIAVDESYSRSGIGTFLMQAVIDSVLSNGARRLILEVRKSNAGAIKFYRRFKFRVVGERSDYYSNPVEDAFVMERDLRF